MYVTCISNSATNLSDEQKGRHPIQTNDFGLTVGRDYLILGMSIDESTFSFLVRADNDLPNFAPGRLFRCDPQPLPSRWHFRLGEGINRTGTDLWAHPEVAMWGYSELIHDISHAASLSELEDEALMIFTREYLRRFDEEGWTRGTANVKNVARIVNSGGVRE